MIRLLKIQLTNRAFMPKEEADQITAENKTSFS